MGIIETSKQVSDMHLASSSDQRRPTRAMTPRCRTELTAATGNFWPRNPALAELSKKIFATGDVQQKAVIDFGTAPEPGRITGRFTSDSPRLMGALAFYPDKAAKLKEVMETMKTIEGALLMRAD